MNSNFGKISIVASVALHLLLALLFLLVRYQLIAPEFKPLQVMQFGYQQVSSSSESRAPLQSASASTDDFKFGKKSNLAPRKVDLPPAQFQADENIFIPQSRQTVRNNLDMNEIIGNDFEKRESNLSQFLPEVAAAPPKMLCCQLPMIFSAHCKHVWQKAQAAIRLMFWKAKSQRGKFCSRAFPPTRKVCREA
ncbi:MAG: hypothetical protein R6U84_00765 [Candidatus Cloacimonadales bacterium]